MRYLCTIALLVTCGIALRALAHCDTMSGPVVVDAKAALEKGDVTPVLKWVKQEHEPEVKAAFAKAQVVRGKGPEARELADHYFIENLVRVHRAGEGAAFTGLKDAPPEPIIAMADKALADGSAENLLKALSEQLAESLRQKFHVATEARKSRDQSVEAGRKFVQAYVTYVHFVENLAGAMASEHAHQAPKAETPAEHRHD